MTGEIFEPCKIVDGNIVFCNTLKSRLNPEVNARKKGLCLVVITDLKNVNHKKVIGVCYKKDRNDNGLMLKYCPWCGSDIRNFKKEDLNIWRKGRRK